MSDTGDAWPSCLQKQAFALEAVNSAVSEHITCILGSVFIGLL